MSRRSEEITVRDGVSTTCPCGGKFTTGYATEDGTPMGFHSMPPCQDYIDRDLLAYLTWLNDAHLRATPPEAKA